jgi:hypothetical protein
LSEWVGWLATAVFVASYFVRPSRLLAVQAAGALTWLAYGLLTWQAPVIVSNVVVAGAAAFRLIAPRLAAAGPRDGLTGWRPGRRQPGCLT